MKRERMVPMMMNALLVMSPLFVWGQASEAAHGPVGDATHESDHMEDEQVEVLETIHVHGLKLNKDQQLGPVPKYTPWPVMPPSLRGQEVDDWMKARFFVSKTAVATLVVLVPAKDRLINLAGVQALKQWTFAPQMDGDDFVDGELTVRLHFRTQEQ